MIELQLPNTTQYITSIIINVTSGPWLTMLCDWDNTWWFVYNSWAAVKIPLCSLPFKKTNENASRQDGFIERTALTLIYKRSNAPINLDISTDISIKLHMIGEYVNCSTGQNCWLRTVVPCHFNCKTSHILNFFTDYHNSNYIDVHLIYRWALVTYGFLLILSFRLHIP